MKNIIFILLTLSFWSPTVPAHGKLKNQKTFNEPHQHDLLWAGEERPQSMLANLDLDLQIDRPIFNYRSDNYRSLATQSLQLAEPTDTALQQ
jgi:hypothetical protein